VQGLLEVYGNLLLLVGNLRGFRRIRGERDKGGERIICGEPFRQVEQRFSIPERRVIQSAFRTFGRSRKS